MAISTTSSHQRLAAPRCTQRSATPHATTSVVAARSSQWRRTGAPRVAGPSRGATPPDASPALGAVATAPLLAAGRLGRQGEHVAHEEGHQVVDDVLHREDAYRTALVVHQR